MFSMMEIQPKPEKRLPQNEGLCQKSKKLDIKLMPANTQLQNI